jgi:hypothetical protein
MSGLKVYIRDDKAWLIKSKRKEELLLKINKKINAEFKKIPDGAEITCIVKVASLLISHL